MGCLELVPQRTWCLWWLLQRGTGCSQKTFAGPFADVLADGATRSTAASLCPILPGFYTRHQAGGSRSLGRVPGKEAAVPTPPALAPSHPRLAALPTSLHLGRPWHSQAVGKGSQRWQCLRGEGRTSVLAL